MFDTQEKLETYLKNHGIVGAWVDHDENGFSRKFKFEVCGTKATIIWFTNYSTIRIAGIADHWFDRIDDANTYPVMGEWLNFKLGENDTGLHLKIK